MKTFKITIRNEVSGKKYSAIYYSELSIVSIQSVLDYLSSSDNNNRSVVEIIGQTPDLFEGAQIGENVSVGNGCRAGDYVIIGENERIVRNA